MSTTRRDFIKKSALFSSGLFFAEAMPASIQRAFDIKAPEGSTFLDAEHIVFLMQENRSFDHCFGTLKGVRGFNDPRAMKLKDGLPVWFQSDIHKNIYSPFRLDIENTKVTWMGGLPHSWKDMVEARNEGKMDNWLIAKRPGNAEYKDLPLTMGYFSRADIPFYYALADAFTVCDQHFCSSLTGTSANRSYFWAGAIREKPRDPNSIAHVDNGQINYKDVSWTTYPERLEKANVSWRVYQNELSVPVGFDWHAESWLANFTDNNLEFYKQYNVRFHKAHYDYMVLELERLKGSLNDKTLAKDKIQEVEGKIQQLEKDIDLYSPSKFEALSEFDKAIHKKAFTTNTSDPDYHKLEEMTYMERGVEKTMEVPKGDIFYQFRKDVDENKLPMVSWLVAPCNFSDHPSAPWFGAWYLSEAIDILTKNPEVWKKTIFVLTYDENDGYFDHIAPFVPPLTTDKTMGKVAKGMDTQDEWVTKEQERVRTGKPDSQLASPIGLGYRVPMIIASPWTRGGWVNSEVLDLTSTIQFLEYFIEKKTGKQVIEENISSWRREVCGNMTSVFQSERDLREVNLDFVDRKDYIARIMNAKEKKVPGDFNAFTKKEVLGAKHWTLLSKFPKQEEGIKKACALPYNLNANVKLAGSKTQLQMDFTVESNQLKNKVYAAPVQVYDMIGGNQSRGIWDFAVRDNEPMDYYWKVEDGEQYHYNVHGPNGFFRSFKGSKKNLDIYVEVLLHTDLSISVKLKNNGADTVNVALDNSLYLKKALIIELSPNKEELLKWDYTGSNGWYDLMISCKEDKEWKQHYAGHIENGQSSITDPFMASLSK
ncbi:phosphocholine-specific phospholipase C [Myroides odoratimimus]|uniref:phosphocholine-specific phospholipase C n=1 Tax=Myroides odoratimimus TaxID=76832 RepID=UPI0024C0C4CC|nr:phospholipase C, phosphocholine-specific [Myroides odoratimimus]WHU38306.1 phospholipase C, phosphocholine-specific [Myroides odoratimimus]